ncbi:MAG TPA: thrombospondin type-1 domain-containing protein [Candidatus Gracilibacteria bacterium]
MKLYRKLTLALVVLTIFGTVMTTKAVFSDSFWIVHQIAERMAFVYRGIAPGGTEYMTIQNDGRVGIGVGDADMSHGAVLELKSSDKALLIPRVEVVGDIATATNGMVVYENKDQCFKLYQQNNWTPCLGVASSIKVASSEPANGTTGDAYYNTILNRLFVHDGQTFVEVKVDFETLTSSNHNCTVHEVAEPNLQVQCPANKQLVSLFYENQTFSNTPDRHLIPEVTGIECCEMTFGTYWWHTSDWSNCSGGTQTRTVTCKDTNGANVSEALCVGSQKSEATQSCGTAEPTGNQCFGGVDKDGNACACGYAGEVTASTRIGVFGPEENVLGFPDAVSGGQDQDNSNTAEFDNEGNTPGSVTVRLQSPVINGPGTDFILHLWDFNPSESFETLVSQDGTTFVSLGNSQSNNGSVSGELSRIGFDVAASQLAEVNFVKIVNANIDMINATEGPDIDAFEPRNCTIVESPNACPTPPEGITTNGGFEDGNTGFYSEYTFKR